MGAAVGLMLGMVAMGSLVLGGEGRIGVENRIAVARAPVDKGFIAYEDSGGTGPVVLCMPGMGDVRGEFRFLAPLLSRAGYRVLVADLRGQGDSSLGFASYRPEDFGDDALAVLRHAGVAKATLIGCSVSAGSIAWAASKAPEHVEALVMLGPAARDPGLSPIKTTMNQWLYGALFSRPWGPSVWGQFYATLYKKSKPHDFQPYKVALVRMLSQPGRMEALKQMIMASKKTVSDRLGSVKAPALLIMGGADPDFSNPRTEAETIQRMLGGTSQVEVLEGLGHYPHVEDPQAVMDLIQRVLPELKHGA